MAERGGTRLVLFPGLGADARLFEAQRRGLPAGIEVEVPGWIEPAGAGETLAEYGRRVAAGIREDGRPLWLGGTSFGGMVAMEVARHVRCEGVILIASCRSCRGLPWVGRVARPLARWVPARGLRVAKSVTGPVRWAFGAHTGEQVRLFREMLRDTPAGQLKWSLYAALAWEGAGQLGVPVYQVHGGKDRVIPCPRRGEVVEIVEGAGHLVNMTHAERVNSFVVRCMTGGGGRIGGL